jgi:hypothetical protein
MTTQDWICGPGGCDHQPVPPFHFLKTEKEGSTPKVEVRDARERIWSVKFGAEATPECFGSRFLMALGYFAEPTYCLANIRIAGPAQLPRGVRRAMRPDGTFPVARFQLRDQKEMQFLPQCSWSWTNNPFLGTHELAGLKIVMMLLSNWDTKDARSSDGSNNGVFLSTWEGKPVLLYSTFDWGGSMGAWGGVLRRNQNDCPGFAADTPNFIKDSGTGEIRWGYSGKSSEAMKSGVTRSDVRWLLSYLGRMTPDQLTVGLTASGASRRQAACWTSSLMERIRQLRMAAR